MLRRLRDHSNHMEVSEHFFDCSFFLSCSLRLNRVLRLGQVIVLSFDNPTLAFGLGDVEIGYMETIILLNPSRYLFISRSVLKSGCVHLLEIELHLYMLTLHVSLGKQDNRLHMMRPGEHVYRTDGCKAVDS